MIALQLNAKKENRERESFMFCNNLIYIHIRINKHREYILIIFELFVDDDDDG